jgi:outer membrane immunogenic protein
MKNLLCAVVALIGLSAPAAAADLGGSSYKDNGGPVGYEGVPVNWTGLYVGIGAGAGSFDANGGEASSYTVYDANGKAADSESSTSASENGGKGAFGTIQIGGDWRPQSSRWVFGAFADYDLSGLAGKPENDGVDGGRGSKILIDDQWTLGGRIGFLPTHSQETLIYGLVGYTQLDETVSLSGKDNTFPDNSTRKSLTHDGWTVGGGIETRLYGNWFLKGEYRYSQLSKETLFSDPHSGKFEDGYTLASTSVGTIEPSVQTARAVLSYRFGLDGNR